MKGEQDMKTNNSKRVIIMSGDHAEYLEYHGEGWVPDDRLITMRGEYAVYRENAPLVEETISETVEEVTEVVEQTAAEPAAPEVLLPPELQSERAQLLLTKAQEHGWLDERWQTTDLLKSAERAVVANEIGERLGLPHRWQTFGQLWGISFKAMRTRYDELWNNHHDQVKRIQKECSSLFD